jgi:hypothetical protein
MWVVLQDQVTQLFPKLLAAWINKSRKEVAPYFTCNDALPKQSLTFFPMAPCPMEMLP